MINNTVPKNDPNRLYLPGTPAAAPKTAASVRAPAPAVAAPKAAPKPAASTIIPERVAFTPSKPTVTPAAAPTKPMTTPSGMQITGNAGTFAGSPQTAQAPQSQFNQPVKGLFGNVAQSLANRSYEGAGTESTTSGLIGAANRNKEITDRAAELARISGEEYARIGRAGANARSGYLSTGTTPVATGNSAIIAQNTAAQQSAIAQGLDAQLKGTAQELTGASQQANALSQAGSLQTTTQGLVQSGLQAAGSLTQPQLAGIGSQQFYDPTGAGNSGGTLPAEAQSAVQNYAQQVKNGQMTRQDAESRLSAYGIAGTNALSQALGSGFNTTVSNAQAGVIAEQEKIVQQYTSSLQQAHNLQTQFGDLLSSFGLNASDLNAANAAIQGIARNTSDYRYQILQNYVNDLASRYAQILTPPGGSATDSTREIAASMIDKTASGESLIKVMESLDHQANAVIAGVRSVSSGQPTSSGSTIQSSSGRTYNLPFNL